MIFVFICSVRIVWSERGDACQPVFMTSLLGSQSHFFVEEASSFFSINQSSVLVGGAEKCEDRSLIDFFVNNRRSIQ